LPGILPDSNSRLMCKLLAVNTSDPDTLVSLHRNVDGHPERENLNLFDLYAKEWWETAETPEAGRDRERSNGDNISGGHDQSKRAKVPGIWY
jgi:hypothetical protein